MAARVVGDDPVTAALERLGAHDDVAARGGQPVEEDDRRPFAGLLAGERHAVALHRELAHRPGSLDA